MPVFALCVAYAVHIAHRPALQAFILCSATLAATCLVASIVEPPLRIVDAWEKRMVGVTTVFVSDSFKSNGLMFDARGYLIACEGSDGGGRRVSRWDVTTKKRETIAIVPKAMTMMPTTMAPTVKTRSLSGMMLCSLCRDSERDGLPLTGHQSQ